MFSSDKFAYIFLFIILAIVYNFSLHNPPDEYDQANDSLINKFLLSEGGSKDKTRIWIHIPTEYNSLRWDSFGSRSSKDVNVDYLYLCMQSIIHHNKNNDIIIISDDAFKTLIPNFNINIELLADPVKSKVRKLCLLKLLVKYGGILTPYHFLCNTDLKHLFSQNNDCFVVEKVDHSYDHTQYFTPDSNFIGCKTPNNDTMKMFMQFVEQIISTDSTDTSNFLNAESKWCLEQVEKQTIDLVCGSNVITKTMAGEPVLIEDLFQNKLIDYNREAYGILIPHNEIKRRVHYNWFLKQNERELKEGDHLLSYFLQKYT